MAKVLARVAQRIGCLTVAVAAFACAPDPPPFLDARAIVGQPIGQVAALLGAPADCEATKRGELCRFRAGKVEVEFIGGRADWITAWPPGVRFGRSAPKAIGLDLGRPTFENQHTLRWDRPAGLLEVSAFPGRGGELDYLFVKFVSP